MGMKMRGIFTVLLATLGAFQLAFPAGALAQFFLEERQLPQNVAEAPTRRQTQITASMNSRNRDSEVDANRPAIASFAPNMDEECSNPEKCPQWGSIPRRMDLPLLEGYREGTVSLHNWGQGLTEFSNSVKDKKLARYYNVAYLTDPAVVRAMTDAERYVLDQINETNESRQRMIQELEDHPQGAMVLANLLGCEKRRMEEKGMRRQRAWLSCIADDRKTQDDDTVVSGLPEELAKPSDHLAAVAPTGGAPAQDNKSSLWDLICSQEIDPKECDKVQGDQKQLCQQIAETNRQQCEHNKFFFGDLIYTQEPNPQNPNVLQAYVQRLDPWLDPNQYLPEMKLKKKLLGIELEYLLNALDSAQALMWLMHEACVSFNKNAPEGKAHDPFDENNFGNAGNLLQTILGAIGINITAGGSSLGEMMPLGQEGLLCGGLDANDASVKKAFAKLSTSRFTYSCEHAKVNFFEFFKHQVRTSLYKSNPQNGERLKCSLIEPTAEKVIEMYRKSLDPKEAKDVLRYIRKSWFKHADEVAMFRIFEMIDLAEEKLSLLSTCQKQTSMCQDALRLIQQKRGKISAEVIQEGLRDAYAEKTQKSANTAAERSGGISQMKPGEPSSSSSTR